VSVRIFGLENGKKNQQVCIIRRLLQSKHGYDSRQREGTEALPYNAVEGDGTIQVNKRQMIY